MLRTALMLPLPVSRPSADATSRARTSVSPACAKYAGICSVSLPYVVPPSPASSLRPAVAGGSAAASAVAAARAASGLAGDGTLTGAGARGDGAAAGPAPGMSA
ncbi:hypothetical protein GCM10010269_78960 [Streptomyces humidus]|uniref:Uncharacterized protein n=1 Tax=Streptomyces humidus TaxID=52259 RepID=A0A918GCL2_9ACTN|nr:hypothetical protein GCM10010269_78960 [Streptomyces humidus]